MFPLEEIQDTEEQTLEEWVEQEINEYLNRKEDLWRSISARSIEASGYWKNFLHKRGALEVLVNLVHCRRLKINEELLKQAIKQRDL